MVLLMAHWRVALLLSIPAVVIPIACEPVKPEPEPRSALVSADTVEGQDPGRRLPELEMVDTVPRSSTAGEIAYFDVREDGTVVFLDRMSTHLVLAPLEGGTTVIGRRGAGPGELEDGTGVVFVSDGGFALLDRVNGRITRWSANGALEGTVGVPTIHSWGLEALGNDLVLKVADSEAGGALHVEFVRFEGLGATDTLRLQPRPELAVEDGPTRGSLHCGPCQFLGVSDSILLLARPASSYVIFRSDLDGRIVGTISRQDLPSEQHSPWSWGVYDNAFLLRATAFLTLTGLPRERLAQPEPDPLPFMPVMAPTAAMGVDSHARVWVLRSTPDPEQSTLDVFDLGGEHLGVREVDVGLFSIRIAGSWLVGLTAGDHGEPRLVRFRLAE